MTRPAFLSVLLGAACALRAGAAVPETVGFNEHIRPILSNTCFFCHGPDEKHRDGKRRLDLREEAIVDHDGVRAIVPGDPDKSELMLRILSHDPEEQMPPPKSKRPALTADEIATFRKWIAQGAKYEGHWAFQPLRTAPPPNADCGSRIAEWEKREPARGAELRKQQPFLENWARNPIDQFILDRLLREGIAPSPEADPRTLCRRMHLDLTGILPTPEEVESFVAESIRNPQSAIRNLADRLLADPHYGERWGRHWLDQARYADSNGYSIDSERAMWPYRDWVIKALNEDMPFDRFTIEQLAGDLLPKPTKSQLIATAFHRNSLINEEGGVKPEQFRVEESIDRLNTTAEVWLGLTVGCAQCHSHKFDPITHQEFYRMFAFFNQGEDVNSKGATLEVARGEVFGTGPTAEERNAEAALKRRADEAAWEKDQLAIQDAAEAEGESPDALALALRVAAGRRNAEQTRLVLEAFEKAQPKYGKAKKAAKKETDADVVDLMVMKDLAKKRETFLFLRGDFLRPDQKLGPLQPGVIAAVAEPMPAPAADFQTRLDLARWLVAPQNPLTARVTMNRVWMRYFGRGIVETEDDFGSQGTPPTHPELLDWLAGEFMRQGWSMKAMHRLIVTSATYRQSSKARPDLADKDARNLLLARQSRVRLEAEIIRDAGLCASGLLNAEIGGPSVRPPQPEGVYSFTQNKKVWPDVTGPNRYRRGLYTMFFRSAPHPLFSTFDAPDFQQVCTRRGRSNTPLQALLMANDTAFFEFAQGLALRAQQEAWALLSPAYPPEEKPGDWRKHGGGMPVRRAFLLANSRPPSAKEEAVLLAYFDAQVRAFTADPAAAQALLPKAMPASFDPISTAALVGTARAILNADSFITRE
ncbi:MAG TPA: PSD1 and planctomycete cytochrome C domain-containing protein [Chthoniobacteraceae bacterium]|jgi:hypothetical protein|nr:PSD1 and planctomycete cytochrome C domain-containing protein [Chthoniobacteraceae bacterium]